MIFVTREASDKRIQLVECEAESWGSLVEAGTCRRHCVEPNHPQLLCNVEEGDHAVFALSHLSFSYSVPLMCDRGGKGLGHV